MGFVEAGGYDEQQWWSADGWAWRQQMSAMPLLVTGINEHPIAGITAFEAIAYCQWRGARLPTEAEWEIAAGWGLDNGNRIYPWGEEAPLPGDANFGEEIGTAQLVAHYPPNVLGLYDIAGNVSEWALSNDGAFVTRGGHYRSDQVDITIYRRIQRTPDNAFNVLIGFRCAADA